MGIFKVDEHFLVFRAITTAFSFKCNLFEMKQQENECVVISR